MRQIAPFMVTSFITLSFGLSAFAQDAPKADNTAQNKGSTMKTAVTAEKQGNKKDQVKILAEVRKSIVDEKGLSMDAKNIKILFSNGVVTLRGPVDSDAEVTKVVDLAKACGGVSSVVNKLTVAPKKH
jgi:osmotically-inducible protein OsmY